MMLTKRLIVIALAIVLVTPFLCGQGSRSAAQASPDVRLVMNPLDEFSRAFGLHDERIEDAARKSLRRNGFQISESSDLTVSVSVIPLSQQDEDLYPFRIEVHGGTALELTAGKAFSPDVIGDIPAVKNIAVPWNDERLILTTTRELTKSVATELRKALRRLRSKDP